MQFSLLEFALVKKIFKPRQCSAAPDWEIHGNTVCPEGNGNISAL